MKKILFTYILAFILMISFNSCEVATYTTTQDDVYVETQADIVQSNVGFDVIIRYGTPYYRNGSLLYYFYDNIYYYPYYYNNYWYVRAYRRPFNHYEYRPYFRPHRYDYRFSPGHYRGYGRPSSSNIYRTPRRSYHNRNNGFEINRRSKNMNRIDQNQKINTRRGNFGPRR